MAGNVSTYLQAARLNWFKGTAHPVAPTNVYVALYLTMPSQANAGGVEVSGTGYARVAVANAGWGAITGSGPFSIATNAATNFGNAGSAWGTILGFGILDAASVGNLLYVDTFASSVVVSNGAPVSFASGIITITETGAQSQYMADARLNWFKGTAYPTAPANTYATLYTTMPSLADAGGVEVSGTGYARVAVASTGWSALTGTNPTTITNAAAVDFGTAGSAWGTVVGYGIRDAAAAGNLLELFTLTSSQAVNNGAPVSFAIGAYGVSSD